MANPRNYPPKTADLLVVQQITQDLFDHTRTIGDNTWDPDDPPQEARISARAQPAANLAQPFQLPLPGSQAANRIRQAGVRNRGTRWDDGALFNPAAENPGIARDDQRFSRATLKDKAIRRKMRTAGVAFVKQLGWGGNALATLWAFSDAAGTTNNVVLKSRYSSQFSLVSMTNEKLKLEMLARSPHIIHRVNLRNHIQDPAATWLSNHDRLLWLEFMRYGDLDGWLRKATQQETYFPRSVLWRLFSCLADQCVSMAWPPRDQPGPGQQPADGPDLPEDIPPAFATGYKNILHFDLDPQNIFLENNDGGDHVDVPRLQLGDFGNACAGADLGLPAPGYEDIDDIWRARQLGKNGWYLPEQFTAEWDYVNYEPYSEGFTSIGAGTGTAGHFTERSNIWAIGLVMRCCVTRSQPDRPPHATPVPSRGPQMGTQGYTYGGELRMQFFTGRFGRDLCRLVSQCLMHRPSDRPSLVRLRQDIAAGVAANPLSPEDRQWVRTTLFGAGNPLPQYPIDPTQAAGQRVMIHF